MKIYDTTLRDGTQGEGISLSVQDKLNIARKLDEMGVHYIEGGWPGSNPKDMEFFKNVRKLKLKNSKIAAFGSTRRANIKARNDANIKALLAAETGVVTIFGKTWDLHVKRVLKTSLKENLKMIEDSVRYLKSKGREVIYDAEHFFDGYISNPEYALETLVSAAMAGADAVALCDTNGGMITSDIFDIVCGIRKIFGIPIGIHCHNDADMAVANSIAAVQAGAVMVQGTINGYGERCGNANLCSVIANLQLKLGMNCIGKKRLSELTEVSRYIAEVCNMRQQSSQPYMGKSAFAHKGGVHINAVLKDPQSYEHIAPEEVGNSRRFLVSELAGRTSILMKVQDLNIALKKNDAKTKKILDLLQNLEHQGYSFEAADASFELIVKKALGKYKKFFELEGFRVIIEKDEEGLRSEAAIKVRVNGVEEHTAAVGDGPVNALDNALRKALVGFYPALAQMHLSDFKVRVLDEKGGTAAKVRVLIQSQDAKDTWSTVGVSENIIEASCEALVDGVEYKLLKMTRNEKSIPFNKYMKEEVKDGACKC